MIKKSICVAGAFVAVIAFADTDPYADYGILGIDPEKS